jgi:hypothetical protein
MAGQAKRLLELDTADVWSQSAMSVGQNASAPHLKIKRSVKDAFQLFLSGKFRAVDFHAGKPQNFHNQFRIQIKSSDSTVFFFFTFGVTFHGQAFEPLAFIWATFSKILPLVAILPSVRAT